MADHAQEARKANKRGAARLAAVQALYQMDLAGTGVNEIMAAVRKPLARQRNRRRAISAGGSRPIFAISSRALCASRSVSIRRSTRRWPAAGRSNASRRCLRAVLRAGAYELACRADVPARVVTAEYVDVAGAFVDKEETGMVNAVLDQLAHELRAAEFCRRLGDAGARRHVGRRAPDRALFSPAGHGAGRVRPRTTTRPSSRRRRAAIWCSRPTAASPACIFFPTTRRKRSAAKSCA